MISSVTQDQSTGATNHLKILMVLRACMDLILATKVAITPPQAIILRQDTVTHPKLIQPTVMVMGDIDFKLSLTTLLSSKMLQKDNYI